MMLVDVFEAFDVFERMEMSRLEEDICGVREAERRGNNYPSIYL
jgi:hypothetical protein